MSRPDSAARPLCRNSGRATLGLRAAKYSWTATREKRGRDPELTSRTDRHALRARTRAGADRAAPRRRTRVTERRTGPARRGGRGQERVAGLRVRPGRRLAASRGPSGVESEMELAYSGLHQLCAPMLDHLDRLPVPQRDALATVFGLSAGPAARPVPGRARHADAVRRGRRAAAAGLHRRRRAVARPGLGADPRVRRPPAPRRARSRSCARRARAAATTSSPGCPSCPSMGSATATRAHCCWTTCTARWMRRSATRSSRRATATRSRCSSCRAPGAPPTSRAGSGCPAASRSPARSNRATCGASACSLPRPQLLVLAAAAEPLGDPVLLHRAAETLGLDMAAADPAVDAGLLKIDGARRVRAPTRPIRRLPLGYRRRPPPRASRPRRRHRRRDRPGPARLAPRPRDAGPGRGGRRRARAFGRPGAGSRRASPPRPRSCSARLR